MNRHFPFCRISCLGVVLSLVLVMTPSASRAQLEESVRDAESAIVKIYATAATPDYFTPWRLLSPSRSTGSGTLIEGGRILTNAHVVADASYIQVQKHNDPERYYAEVSFVSHASDLALLTVEDEAFHEGMGPLELGELPEPHSEVYVLGFPVGGRTLSITRGILSRVEQQTYAHSGEYLLAGQIDAAINPGNSGGPVVANGRIAGVVMQSARGSSTEALGYFVPPSIIRHVLTDSEDGVHDGFPDLGFRSQDMESPAARAAYGLSSEQSGVLVIKVFENSPADGMLRENDVLLSVDGYDVAGDSSIRTDRDVQADYKHAIDLKQIGDDVELVFMRNGRKQSVRVTARRRQDSYTLVRPETFDRMPEYMVYGGIVFVPLNMNLIKRWGRDWNRSAPVSFLQAREQWISPERREAVVALQVLAADVNLGYHDLRNWIVEEVNGTPVRDFQQFARMLRDTEEAFTIFSNEAGRQVVIDHEQAMASRSDVLERYRVPAPWSPGLLD